MNQRVVAIVLVALLAVCFVGSCTVAAVALVGKASEEVAEARRDSPERFSPKASTQDEPETSVAPDLAPLDPDTELPDDTAAARRAAEAERVRAARARVGRVRHLPRR